MGVYEPISGRAKQRLSLSGRGAGAAERVYQGALNPQASLPMPGGAACSWPLTCVAADAGAACGRASRGAARCCADWWLLLRALPSAPARTPTHIPTPTHTRPPMPSLPALPWQIIGVEPCGANAMAISLARGERATLSKVDAFADGVAVKQVRRGPGRRPVGCWDGRVIDALHACRPV